MQKCFIRNILSVSALCLSMGISPAVAKTANPQFNRVASFPVFNNSDIASEAVAEIVASNAAGDVLIYTDSESNAVGFVDINDPSKPVALGLSFVGGEPTSVATHGEFALIAVNTSTDLAAPSGKVEVIDFNSRNQVQTLDLSGQPDSIAISPDGRFAAIAIENERDEDLGNGEPPQTPGGFLTILDLDSAPGTWRMRTVDLNGIADLFPNDAEPEYVAINEKNIAVVTLQENNHIILVDLASGQVINDFSAGTVDLTQVDTIENNRIELNSALFDVPREPDGVTWINDQYFATADEGDLFGGSRGFSIFSIDGDVVYSSGNSNDHLAAALGHYPEGRSENKGVEPENVAFSRYGEQDLLFVGSERASLVYVYDLSRNVAKPKLQQILPTGVAPEGLLTIPERDLLVVASEADARASKFRSVLNIYSRSEAKASYPTIVSKRRSDSTPIPWGALSGLASHPFFNNIHYAIGDSFYEGSRIFTLNTRRTPAELFNDMVVRDNGQLAAIAPERVNADGSVNLDLEGIATRPFGGFWLVSEGAGAAGDETQQLNLLLKVSYSGVIQEVITLPEAVNAKQIRFGLEGVARTGFAFFEKVYVAFQREWVGDPDNLVRIGQYTPLTGEWKFFYYPIDTPLSANGGWVGLSDISAINSHEFAVIERDNQGGPDAVIKKVYRFSIAGLQPLSEGAGEFPVVSKTLVMDLVPELKATGGNVLEKIEGLSIQNNGTMLIVNDNDGVDDSNGETQLLKFRNPF